MKLESHKGRKVTELDSLKKKSPEWPKLSAKIICVQEIRFLSYGPKTSGILQSDWLFFLDQSECRIISTTISHNQLEV